MTRSHVLGIALAVCVLISGTGPLAGTKDLTSPLVSVLEGNTLEVLRNNKAERIRLSGIDCPEKGQADGKRAKQAASELVFWDDVTSQMHGKDKYERTIADVLLPDGTLVNHTLVKDGWCWCYRKYALLDTKSEGLEQSVREGRKGLWANLSSVPPRILAFEA